MTSESKFELRATDVAGRIGSFQTKTCTFETPALLPVVHPVKQLLPCSEIKSIGFEAVMTNAYTTLRRLHERAHEGIHKIIGFEGTIMTDSGGYQVLEFGSLDVDPLEIAAFEEKIGSDIAVILDQPTGLDVTRSFARKTVAETLRSAKRTLESISRDDIIWTVPVQGGKYLDLVSKSAKSSAKLDCGCFALGSPTEVMERYDFATLVQMIVAARSNLPDDRPFHLFGAGHPLIIPLAVALGCDMFDSASYMLYAKQDRYISSVGTIRLEKLEYLPCICKVCSSISARELKGMKKEERVMKLANHNLSALKQVIEETKQAIWEERLWEYARSKCSNHPLAFEAFGIAMRAQAELKDVCTPDYKDRGIFISDEIDILRPEVARHQLKLSANVDLKKKTRLVITPETRTKPFLVSDLFNEMLKLVDLKNTLVCYASPVFGLVPAEISDVFPISQSTQTVVSFPEADYILNSGRWERIDVLLRRGDPAADWLYGEIKNLRRTQKQSGKKPGKVVISRNYKSFKERLSDQV